MNRLKKTWINLFDDKYKNEQQDWWDRKKELWIKREAKIIQIKGNGHHYRTIKYDDYVVYEYLLYLSFLTKQKGDFFQEEHMIPFQFRMKNGKIIDHKMIARKRELLSNHTTLPLQNKGDFFDVRFSYDRLQAVKYAQRWWNSYNPLYKQFTVDCTNYVSQCLRAGGAPMRGMPDRNQGWWYQENNWSFSWSVAHSLRWYLSGSREGLQGKEVETAEELNPGDVICYDFEGDGRWDHNTIVVAKDARGEPLVNAHTYNSRQRYWSYEDSTAWTPNIKYKFFQIGKT